MRSKLLYKLNDSADRSGKQDEVALGTRRNGISDCTIDRAKFPCLCEHRFPIAADDPAAESMFLHGKAERTADQAGADDGDLAE